MDGQVAGVNDHSEGAVKRAREDDDVVPFLSLLPLSRNGFENV